MDKFEDIPERLAFNLTEMINKSINDLKSYIQQFENCLKEMRKIEKQFRTDFSLIAKKQAMGENSRDFHELEVVEQVERTIQEIVDMYETEFTLRKQVLAEIQESISLNPLMITAYLVLWASEIYIEHTRIHELIEEFSYAEKIYQSQRQSQDSYNFVDVRKKP